MALPAVDLPDQYAQPCERGCGRPAVYIAKGCSDHHPVSLCEECYERGIEVVKLYVHWWMRTNKRVLICDFCHRPVLRLDTHLEVRKLQ